MLKLKAAWLTGLLGTVLVTIACGDSSNSLNPTAPSVVPAATMSSETGDSAAESGATAKGGNPGKPDKPDNPKGKDREEDGDDDRGPSTGAPTNPVTGRVQIEGLISGISGSSLTVNGQTVLVPLTAVIRHGSRAVAYSELRIGDRVHVVARMQTTALEASEVKLQNPGGGDDAGEDDDDDDNQGTVWVALLDPTASESGINTGTFRLTRSASAALPLTSPLTVSFTLNGTATNGTDYASTPLTATFLAGQATVDIVVTPIADSLAEGSETVVLALTAAAPYTIGSPISGTVTIADAAPVVSVTASDAAASETGPDFGTFRLARTGSTTDSLTVTYTLTGTAVNGTDYQVIPLTVTFLAGQATADVFVIPTLDGTTEGAETATLTLTDGATYDLGAPATATATINIAG
jgi:hypothetical protein